MASNIVPSSSGSTLQQQSGVVNFGHKYEDTVPAYFALRLLQDETIKSFSFRINPASYLKFDDLVIKINYINGAVEHFAVQLKHREKNGTRYILEAQKEFNQKKPFYIEAYREAYEKLEDEIRANYKFILFTNARFEHVDQVQEYEITNVNNTFNNLFESDNVYRFKRRKGSTREEKFFNDFFLFSEQKDYHEFRQSIVDIFRDEFYSDETTAELYLSFFSDLRGNCYKDCEITRDAVIIKLKSLLLKNFLIRVPLAEEREDKIRLVEDLLKEFDITLLRKTDEDFITSHWKYLSENISDEDMKQLEEYKISKKNTPTSEEQKFLFLCHLKEKPIFVKFDDRSRKVVTKVVHLCKSLDKIKLRFVLVGTQTIENDFNGWKIFHILSDLENQQVFRDIVYLLKISLQGKNAISIAEFKTDFDLNLDMFITPDEIFKWLEDDLVFGKKVDNLPKPHISRKLRRTKFSFELLDKACEEKVTIVECNGNLKPFKQFLKNQNSKVKILDLKDFEENPSDFNKSAIILTDKKFSTDENCHHLKLLTEGNSFMFEWIKDEVSPEAPELFTNQINAVCDDPGFGKTTMMKFLASKCPSSYWVVSVSLKQMELFFQKKLDVNEILDLFLQNEENANVFEYLKNKKRVVFFLDGLDELKNDCLAGVVKIIKILVKEEYKIWIFSTKIMRGILENDLKIYSIYYIEKLNKQHQIDYIREKLKSMSQESVKKIENILFEEKADVYGNILQVPLYLYIVTEILRKKKKLTNLEDMPTLTKIYSSFIDGELQHYLNKSSYKDDNYIKTIFDVLIHYYTRECQIAALKSCLDPATFDLLKINNDEKFLDHIKENRDFLGLIIKVNEDNTVVFTHNSFIEFFAAMWLVENFKKLPADKRRFIFHPNYSGIRYFFDVKLAENHPLHLAIINHDFAEVERLASVYLNDVDEGGRRPLHLASSLGKYHPTLKKENASQVIKKVQHRNCKKHEEIFTFLVNSEDKVLDKDKLFAWNSFQYADASASLYSLEKLSEKKLLDGSFLKNCTDLFTLCYYCVTFGYIEIFKKIVQLEDWPVLDELENQLPKPFLHLALENDQIHFGICLIELGVDLSKVDTQKRTALHEAAAYGHREIAEILLDKNLCIEAKDVAGRTPLQLAAKMGHLDVVDLLVKRGADRNTRDFLNRRSPLHKAAYTGKTQVIQYLIENGVAINTLDKNRKSALQRAAEMGHYDTVMLLVEKGITIDTADKNGKTPLHYAALEGRAEIVKYLIRHGASIVNKDVYGNTPREVAADRGHEDIVEILKDEEKHSECKLPENLEQSSIHQAAHRNNLEEIKTLLDQGTNIEESLGGTILHIAALEGHTDLVEYLLQKGANTAAKNIDSRVPLHLAALRGHVDVVKLLLGRGQDNVPDKFGISPLQKAAFKGHLKVVEAFISAGVNINTTSEEGGTALHSAVCEGNVGFIEWLLTYGADTKIKNNNGKTCLHVASQRGNLEALKLLVTKVPDLIDETDQHGKTALHWAVEKGYEEIVRHLVGAGAKINIEDSENKTPIDVAGSISGREEISEYLQSQIAN